MWLSPFMPATSERIYSQLNLPLPKTFAKGSDWEGMPASLQLGDSSPLFPRIEVKT
jgi:methionyl-tRNA synthetase